MDRRLEDLYQAREEIRAVLKKYDAVLDADQEDILLGMAEEGGDQIRWESLRGEDTKRQDYLQARLCALELGQVTHACMKAPDGGWEYREVTLEEIEAEIADLARRYS